jgi:hypothetical protein
MQTLLFIAPFEKMVEPTNISAESVEKDFSNYWINQPDNEVQRTTSSDIYNCRGIIIPRQL